MEIPYLSVFAEVSIALLGFSGLASALNQVSIKNRSFITIRLKALLMLSGSALLASLAPLTGLDLYYCNMLYCTLTAWILYLISRDFLISTNVSPSRFLVVLTFGWGLAAVCFQLFALSLRPDLVATSYVFALSGSITAATLFFIRFVLAMVQEIEE